MEKKTDTTDYETPLIEDHGDLTELTAASHRGSTFDATYTVGTTVPPTGATTLP
jgi:hypothetical protein